VIAMIRSPFRAAAMAQPSGANNPPAPLRAARPRAVRLSVITWATHREQRPAKPAPYQPMIVHARPLAGRRFVGPLERPAGWSTRLRARATRKAGSCHSRPSPFQVVGGADNYPCRAVG
jgi:hypothetical protein